MRALVKESAGPGIVLREVPVPACGPSDALIKVYHAGVCGTDLHIWEWDSWASGRLKLPVIVGHEFAGEITKLGRDAAAAGLLPSAIWSLPRDTSSAGTASNAASGPRTFAAGLRSSESIATALSPTTSPCQSPMS